MSEGDFLPTAIKNRLWVPTCFLDKLAQELHNDYRRAASLASNKDVEKPLLIDGVHEDLKARLEALIPSFKNKTKKM